MFMNKYSLILSTVLACICMQSCIYDEIKDCPTPNPVTDGKCYMSLKFEVKSQRGNGLTTKTFEPTYADEEFERTVSDFRIFLVKKDEATAPVVELKDIPMLDAVTTLPFEIESTYKHGYLLYVVANSNGTINLDLSSTDAFRGTYKLLTREACANVWQRDHFLMVNVNNEASDFSDYLRYWTRWSDWITLEHTDPTPYGGVPVEIDDSKDYTYDNPYRVSVKLERLAVKVVVSCNSESYDFSGYSYNGVFKDVHVDGVSLLNTSNSTNLVQQWQIACYQGPEIVGNVWVAKYKDELSADAPIFYPYLWPITPGGDISTVPSQIYYSQVANFTDFDNEALREGADSYFQALDANKTATLYCLENASPLYAKFMSSYDNITIDTGNRYPLETCMRNRATAVLFRVRAKLQDDVNNTGDLIEDPDKGMWNTGMTKMSSDDGYKTFYCYNSMVTSRLNLLLDKFPDLTSQGITTASTVKELRNAGVKVYEDGYMYYMHWIMDQNYQYFWSYTYEEGEAYPFNYYAVMRNTRYEVNVSKVKDLGMDLPGRETYRGNILEGVNFMLYPIVRGSYDSWFDEDDIENLKNKAI